jgi:hypothetical protein
MNEPGRRSVGVGGGAVDDDDDTGMGDGEVRDRLGSLAAEPVVAGVDGPMCGEEDATEMTRTRTK